MAQEIARDFGDQPLTVLGVLTGSLMVVADLVRQLPMPLKIAFVQAASYSGATTTAGELHLGTMLREQIAGRDVLVVDDIFDTGRTLRAIVEQLQLLGASSIRTAVLLRKKDRQQVTLPLDYVGFEIPNVFVVGFGLDYDDAYRQLPYVAALEVPDSGPGKSALP